jgi:hypothetical protein
MRQSVFSSPLAFRAVQMDLRSTSNYENFVGQGFGPAAALLAGAELSVCPGTRMNRVVNGAMRSR